MRLKKLILLSVLCVLAACAREMEEFIVVEPVSEEPALEETPQRSQEVCPQSGDGIGGTGCPDSEF